MNPLPTIEEYNKDALETEISCSVITYTPQWRPRGVQCPCGCGGELLWLDTFPIMDSRKEHVRCPTTGKEGIMRLDGTPRGVIESIDWEEKE